MRVLSCLIAYQFLVNVLGRHGFYTYAPIGDLGGFDMVIHLSRSCAIDTELFGGQTLDIASTEKITICLTDRKTGGVDRAGAYILYLRLISFSRQ